GVNITGNTFSGLPSTAYFIGDGSYDPLTIEGGGNSFPKQNEIYIIQNGVRQDGVYTSIQAAINASTEGDTIMVGADTYNENVVVDVSNLTIEGFGGAVTLQGTFKSDNGIANGGVMAFLESGAPYSQTAGRGFDIEANNVTLKNLDINGFAYGVNLGNGSSTIDGATLNNVAITDSLVGVHKGTTFAITNLAIDGGSMSDGLIGNDFDINPSAANYNKYTANGVTIDGTDFSDYAYKGIYAETLSNADINGITMENVGQYGAPSTSGTAGTSGDGIDLNLKNGSYSNIIIENFNLNAVGASNENGNQATGDAHGGAIVIEARDSGSYANAKGTVTGPVVIENGTIEGGTSTGIQVGEPGQPNLDGPNVNISNVAISGAEHDAGHGDVANVTAGTTTMTLQANGQTVYTSPTSIGNIVFNSSANADTITGHGENDTVNYTETLNVADFSYNSGTGQWTVNAGGTDVDTLSGVEIVQGAQTGRYLLVGGGGFASVQSAVDAAQSGDTILIAPGDWGTVDIPNGNDENLTIEGLNAGLAPSNWVAANDVTIGTVSSNAASLTIKGIEIDATTENTVGGPYWNSILFEGDPHNTLDVENSMLTVDVPSGNGENQAFG